MNEKNKNHIRRDILIIILSIVFAVYLSATGSIQELAHAFKGSQALASFIAGMFFTSIFTTAPSISALGQISLEANIFTVAVFGSIGAMLGDLVIFYFIRDSISEDLNYLLKKTRAERLAHIFHTKYLRWFAWFAGAAIIASPIPDEVGLAIMGLSKTKTSILVPVSLVMNFIGILMIGYIANSIF